MLTGKWARGVTAVQPVAADGTARWEGRDADRFRLVVEPAGARGGRPERGVFFAILYPFGQVPAFQDGDLYIFESRAICKYVCRKNKPELLKDGDLKESAIVDVWLEVEAHQYSPALSPILFEVLIKPMIGGTCDQKVVEENLAKLKKVLEVYEARLSKCKYLAGDSISLADLNHVSMTLTLMATPHASVLDAYPHVKAWWTGLMERPSVQKVAALMKPSA